MQSFTTYIKQEAFVLKNNVKIYSLLFQEEFIYFSLLLILFIFLIWILNEPKLPLVKSGQVEVVLQDELVLVKVESLLQDHKLSISGIPKHPFFINLGIPIWHTTLSQLYSSISLIAGQRQKLLLFFIQETRSPSWDIEIIWPG